MKHSQPYVFLMCMFFLNTKCANVGPYTPGTPLCNYIGSIGLATDLINSKINSLLDETILIESHINQIDQTIQIIESNTDQIENQSNEMLSIISTIQSFADNIETSMDPSNFVVDGRKSLVSVFGDQIVENRDDMINIPFFYGIPSFNITTSTSGGGAATSSLSMAVLSSSTGATGFAQIQTKRRLRYITGREGYCFFTAMFNNSAANSVQWIGLFDTNDGAAIGFNGTTFSALFRRNTVDTIIPQASFNMDPINGTGPSGFNINPATLNVFRISYGWLGAAPITYQVLDQTGQWISFHQIKPNNISTTPSFLNPVLPMTALIQKTSGATNLTLSSASWSAGVVHTLPSAASRYFTVSNPGLTSLAATPTETHLLTIRNNTTYNSFTNNVEVRLIIVTGGTVVTTTDLSIIRIRKNATVTGTSFSNVDAANSVVSFSTAGTYSAGTGTEVLNLPNCTSGNGPLVVLLPHTIYEIIILPGETLTVTGSSLSGGGETAVCSLGWEELF